MGLGHGRKWIFNNNDRDTFSDLVTRPNLIINANSSSFEADGTFNQVVIYVNGSQVLNSSAPRSYGIGKLTQTNGSWSFVSYTGYDVYGDPVAADNCLAALQGFQNGEMLVLNTWDEPNNRRTQLAPTLRDSFGSKIYDYQAQWAFRDMHLLIAVKGKGLIYEEYRTRYANGIKFSGYLR